MTSLGHYSLLLEVACVQSSDGDLAAFIPCQLLDVQHKKQQTKKKAQINKTGFVFEMFSFVLSCVCPELQMLGSVPPSSLCVCACVYTNGITARFFCRSLFFFWLLLLPRCSLCCARQPRMEPFCLLQFLK